jgi:hypothetical protein
MFFNKKTGFLILTAAGIILVAWIGFAPVSGIFRKEGFHFKSPATEQNQAEDSLAVTKNPRVPGKWAVAMEAADESIRLQELEDEKNGLNILVFYKFCDKGGQLTDKAAKAAALTEVEKRSVAGILHAAWEVAADNFVKNAVLNEEKSNINDEQYVYNIKAADPDGSAWKAFISSLDTAIGEKKRTILMRGLNSIDSFGKLGSLDLTIELLPRKGIYKFATGNPKTGESYGFGQEALTKFSDRFGETFDFKAMRIATYNDPTTHD